MENKHNNSEAETLVAENSLEGNLLKRVIEKSNKIRKEREEQAKKITLLGNAKTEIRMVDNRVNIGKISKNTKRKILSIIGAISFVGAIGAGTYMCAKVESKKETVKEKNQSTNTKEEVVILDSDVDEEIYTDKEFNEKLEKYNIRATSENFNYQTQQLHAKALMLKVDKEDNINFSWLPITEQITRTKEENLVVAVKITNPNLQENPLNSIRTKGVKIRAKVVDKSDPKTIYFYIDCKDKVSSDQLAQISIANPKNTKKNIWVRSFLLPDCK